MTHLFTFSYFTGVETNRIGERHLYRVSHQNLSLVSVSCVTCDGECGHARVLMSSSCSSYVLHCQGPSIPFSAVFSLPDNKLVSVLDSNQHIRSFLERRERPTTRIISLPSEIRIRSESPGPEPEVANVRIKLTLPPSVVNREGENTGLVIFLGDERGGQQVDKR